MTDPKRTLEILDTLNDLTDKYHEYVDPVSEFVDSIYKEFDTGKEDNEDIGFINFAMDINNKLLAELNSIRKRLLYVDSWILDKYFDQESDNE